MKTIFKILLEAILLSAIITIAFGLIYFLFTQINNIFLVFGAIVCIGGAIMLSAFLYNTIIAPLFKWEKIEGFY